MAPCVVDRLHDLHLLWKIPNVVTNGKLGAIACPPQLIVTPPPDHTLHLLHYEGRSIMRVEAWSISTGSAPDPVYLCIH